MPVTNSPTPCAKVGGRGSSRSDVGLRRGSTARRKMTANGCRRMPATVVPGERRRNGREKQQRREVGAGEAQHDVDEEDHGGDRRDESRAARVDAGGRVRGGGACGCCGCRSGCGARVGSGLVLGGHAGLPMMVVRRSETARRSGAPPMRARTVPRPSRMRVVGVCSTL